MIILDTNIFIYLANGALNRRIIADLDIAHASITKVEALGFPDIQANEQVLLRNWFNESFTIALTDQIAERAITLRQLSRMSLGDAIIAATALEHNLELWTANIRDFRHVEDLHLVNPLAQD